VSHEGLPAALATRDAADWALKLITIGVIVGLLN